MLLLALVVGMVAYVIMRLQMITMELSWLRRYTLRLLTGNQEHGVARERDEERAEDHHPTASDSVVTLFMENEMPNLLNEEAAFQEAIDPAQVYISAHLNQNDAAAEQNIEEVYSGDEREEEPEEQSEAEEELTNITHPEVNLQINAIQGISDSNDKNEKTPKQKKEKRGTRKR